MEAKNLRIGNYITLTKSFKEFCESRNVETSLLRVTKIGYQEVELNRLIDANVSTIEAIPLTIEWLIKLGFNDDYNKGYLGIDVNSTDFVITKPKMMGEWQNGYAWQYKCTWEKFTEFKYVHELQNLFFAITGQELELKDEI